MKLFGNRGQRGTACLAFCPQGISLAWVVAEKGGNPVVRAAAYAPDRQVVGAWVKGLALRRVPFIGLFHPALYPLLPADAPREAPREEWPAIMGWLVADRLDFPVDEAVVDYFECPGERQPPQLYVAVTRQQEVVRCVQFFQEHRLHLQGIGIWELALAGLVALLTGVGVHGLLYLDETVTLLLLVEDGAVQLVRRLSPGEPRGRWGDELIREVQRGLDYFENQSHGGTVSVLSLLSPVWETAEWQAQWQQRTGRRAQQCLEQLGPVLEGPVVDRQTLSHCLPAIGAAWRREVRP